MRFAGQSIIEFHIGTLDNPNELIPDRHWFDSERLSWFEVADDLPRFYKIDVEAEPTHHGPKGDLETG